MNLLIGGYFTIGHEIPHVLRIFLYSSVLVIQNQLNGVELNYVIWNGITTVLILRSKYNRY